MNVFFQLYHDENELHLTRSWRDYDDIRLVLDQHAKLDFYSASSLKQQSMGRYVAPL